MKRTLQQLIKRSIARVTGIGLLSLSMGVSPGHAQTYLTENFNTASGTTMPAGWSNVSGPGTVGVVGLWSAANPGALTITGPFSGQFALFNSDVLGNGNTQDGRLTTPSINLSTSSDPIVTFAEQHRSIGGQVCSVQYSTDGGTTWTTLVSRTTDVGYPNPATYSSIILKNLGGQPDVKIRWLYTGSWGWWWAIDSIVVREAVKPLPPTTLSFTGVTSTAMTVNWIDSSTNENSFNVYISLDGITYSLLTNIPSTTSAAMGGAYSHSLTGLPPNKTFYYRVVSNAEVESSFLSGNQATSAPGVVVSTASGGSWSSPATWAGGAIPASGDSVVIANGATVTIDVTTAVCSDLTVGQGASGILNYLSGTASTLTVTNKIYVAPGAVFNAGAGTLTTHNLNIGGTTPTGFAAGSLRVDGTFDMSTTAGVTVSFFGVDNATISGTPTALDFHSVTLNKGTSSTNRPTLDIQTAFTVQGSNTVGLIGTHTAGLLKLSGSYTENIPLYSATAYTIPANGGVWLTNANFTVAGQTGNPTCNGLLRVTSGTYNIGTTNNNSLGFGAGAVFTVEGGTINATGRINTANAITFNCSGGTINVATVGNSSSANPAFGITSTASTANISGGTLNIVQRNTGATIIDYNVAAGTGSVTGGTLRVGTAATATNFDFRIRGAMPSVVVDNTTNNKNVLLGGATTVFGSITIPANDTFSLNNNTLQVTGSVSNNGHISGKGTGVIQFTGSAAQTYAGSGGVDSLFRIINDNDNGGVTFSKSVFAQSVYFYDTTAIHNSANITLGYNNLPVTLQYGQAAGTKTVGQFDVSPTMNVGTGVYSITYAQESSPRTSGFEIPVSRTIRNLTVNNSNGVVLNGGALNLEVGGVLTLTNGTLTTSTSNIINVTDSIVAAVSGGSATSYVNGPMTRQLPSSLTVQRTYRFPVGKSTYKLLELINPGTGSGGPVTVSAETFDANSGGTAGANMTTVDTTQYWNVQLTAGAANMDSTNIRVVSSGLNGLSRLAHSSSVGGAYDKVSGIPLSSTQIATNTTRIGSSAIEGFYGLGAEIANLNGLYLVGASQTAPHYTNLTSVIADLNSKQIQGNVIFELQADYNATTETFPLTFTEPVKTSPNWTITIQPASGTTDSIHGSYAGPLVNLSGIRNVILEGRQGGSGMPKSLIVRNNNTGGTATAVTLVNDARSNILRYAVFKGASTSATAGVITFGTGITTGNDSNAIHNCDIADAATTPATGISSQGSTDVIAKYNDYNTVMDCNVYNFFNSSAEANGFKISNGNNNWTITGNSIYQTTARNTSALHYTFNFQNADNRNALNNMQVLNNYIGGSEPMCTGAPWTMTSAGGRICSFFNMGNLAMSNVSHNIFANFNCATTSTATGAPGTWNAIQYANGMLNIDSNTIGNADTSSIVLNTGSAGVALPIAVIASSTAGTYSITGNKIGSIKMNGGGTTSNNLTCINITSAGNTITYNVDHNVIGNSFPENLIAMVSNSGTAQSIIGINNTSSANVKIRNNTVHNITNMYDGTGTGRIVGIASSGGKDSIINNAINTLKSMAPQTGTGANAGVVGISFTSTNGGSLISRNTVYGLSNIHATAAVKITGVHYSGGTGDRIGRNNIHSFSTVSDAIGSQQIGINYAGGTSTVQNNMVRLGIDVAGASQIMAPAIIGMNKSGGNLNAYFNSVYVGGTGVSDSIVSTYAFNKSSSNSDTVYNNIFVNQRSNNTTGGGHYAISLNNTTGWVADNNVYYVNGTGDTLAIANGITYQGIGDWKLATSKDAASIFGDPSFVNETGDAATVDLHLTGATPAEGTGMAIASIDEDFDGDDRSAFTPTDIGADGGNFIPVDLSPPSISFAAISSDTITTSRLLADYFTIADLSGVKLTGANAPRFYFKKKTDNDIFAGNTSGDNGWKYVSISSLSSPYSFAIDYSIINGGSVSIGDTIQYFIVAQDSAASPNVGAIPSTGFVASSVSTVVAAPTSPGSYAIVDYPLGGTYTVGVSVPADYPTIAAAIAAANGLGVKAPVTFSLIDPLYDAASGETFPITIGQVSGSSAINTITISPASGVAAVIAAPAGAVAVFKLQNSRNIILDGVNTGGSSLTLTDSTTASATAVVWLASTAITGPGCKNIAVKNMTLNGGSNSTTTSYGIAASVDGAAPSNTAGMDNDTITISGNTILKTYYGIYANGTAAVSAGGLDFWNISDNIIGPDTFGSDEIGLAGIWMANALNVNITGDTIRNLNALTRTGAGALILSSNVNGANILKNTIRSITGSALVSLAGSLTGILIGNNVINTTVSKNIIKGLSNTNTGGYGVRGVILNTAQATSNAVLSNNLITDLWCYADPGTNWWPAGIYIEGTTGTVKIYNNTVNLFGQHPGLTSATGSAALLIVSSGNNLDVRNNIFVNSYENSSSGTEVSYAFYSVVANTVYSNIDFNDYFVSGTSGVLGFLGTAQPTLAGLRTVTGQDVSSVNINPQFVSNVDLRPGIGTVTALGTSIPGITTDILDSTRNNPPSIGAYEYGVDVSGPAIIYTPIININSTSNYVLTGFATMTDITGVNVTPGTMPRIYYKKRSDDNVFGTYPADNNASFNGWKYAEASNASSPFDFTIDYSVLTGGAVVQGVDTIQYFVTAQDISSPVNFVSANPSVGFAGSDVNTITAAPATPNQYIIVDAPLAGPYNVGAGLVAPNYPTITAAIGDMNLRGISAAVTFNLVDVSYTTPAETFPIVITPVVGSSDINTVTIKPAAGVITSVSGLSSTSIFKVHGADNFIIDGSNSGGTTRDMTVENTSTSTTSAVIWIGSAGAGNGASNNIIQNLNITGNAGTTTAAGIVSGSGTTLGAAADSANSYNTIRGCSFIKAQNGIFAIGNATNLDMNWVIANNVLGSSSPADVLGLRGIAIQNAGNFNIAENTVQGVVTATTATSSGILVGAVINGGLVQKNKISDVKNINTGGWGCNGIFLNSSSPAANVTLQNNFVSDIAAYGYALATGAGDNGYGIVMAAGGGYNLYYNSVHMNTSQNVSSLPAALNVTANVTAPSSLDIRNNIFMNTQTQAGEKYAVYFGATNAVVGGMDYNSYFTTTGANFANMGATNINTLVAMQGAFGGNLHSMIDSTSFVSVSDLHLTGATLGNLAYTGTPIAGITTDIDGDTRVATHPYIGADENVANPLPVKFTAFTAAAKANDVLVSWTTASEINNKGFEVQRSVDGRSFVYAGFVKGAGNSTRTLNYSLTDAKAFETANSNVLYYRLKQADFDGNFIYTNVVKVVKYAEKANALSAYPNPFSNAYSVSFNAASAGVVTLTMIDLQGKMLTEQTSNVVKGLNEVKFENLANLTTGIYFVKVTVDGETQVLKLVKN